MIDQERLINQIGHLERVIVIAPRRSGKTTALAATMRRAKETNPELALSLDCITHQQYVAFTRQYPDLVDPDADRRKRMLFVDETLGFWHLPFRMLPRRVYVFTSGYGELSEYTANGFVIFDAPLL